mmetsp:Transcript_70215/g.194233  ORF Transcript_70215/g.194233 Transcript_70215/m.194233 type:complete len:287 (-) Transcript_70215:573-1433(-)
MLALTDVGTPSVAEGRATQVQVAFHVALEIKFGDDPQRPLRMECEPLGAATHVRALQQEAEQAFGLIWSQRLFGRRIPLGVQEVLPEAAHHLDVLREVRVEDHLHGQAPEARLEGPVEAAEEVGRLHADDGEHHSAMQVFQHALIVEEHCKRRVRGRVVAVRRARVPNIVGARDHDACENLERAEVLKWAHWEPEEVAHAVRDVGAMEGVVIGVVTAIPLLDTCKESLDVCLVHLERLGLCSDCRASNVRHGSASAELGKPEDFEVPPTELHVEHSGPLVRGQPAQ